MSAFVIDPPVRIPDRPDVLIRNLDEAADFVRRFHDATRQASTSGVLFRLERAATDEDAKEAADAFRWWLEQNRLSFAPRRST
jgi:hypothetical protein